jgi:hypothetical protein
LNKGGSEMIKLRNTNTVSISSGTIAASGSYTTDAYDATELNGYFSLEWTVTGDGTMKAEVLVSNGGSVFHDLDTDITTGQTKSTGTSGCNMASFKVTPCNQLKIKFTETGTADTIAVIARLKAI